MRATSGPNSTAADAALAAELGRVLRVLCALRRTRRDALHLERQAESLLARLASLRLASPA
jgi:hypothetical protein